MSPALEEYLAVLQKAIAKSNQHRAKLSGAERADADRWHNVAASSFRAMRDKHHSKTPRIPKTPTNTNTTRTNT